MTGASVIFNQISSKFHIRESGASSASGHIRHMGYSSLAPLITYRESYRDVTSLMTLLFTSVHSSCDSAE